MLNTKLLGSVSAAPSEFVEDVFSTYLYTGNGSTQTITNGIDLAGEGGLVWIKGRSSATPQDNHQLYDTVRGAGKTLITNISDGEYNFLASGALSAFTSTGFSLNGAGPTGNRVNASGQNVCSWTFREAPKFFDVVTYTGNGTARTISHNLGSVPGMIIVKKTSAAGSWMCYHRSLGYTKYLVLNFTDSAATDAGGWSADPTSTNFSVGSYNDWNQSGQTYVAYLFAHNAGGFGAAGTDNVISCGSYTGNGTSGNTVNLGFEPQYLLIKRTDTANSWFIQDVMRDMSVTNTNYLQAESSNAETNFGAFAVFPNATGFTLSQYAGWNASGGTYIYMAIRRPMKPPTSGTEVFSPSATSATTGTVITTGFPVDTQIERSRSADTWIWTDRLRGINTNSTDASQKYLSSSSTAAEAGSTGMTLLYSNTGYSIGSAYSGSSMAYYNFRRATGFFDVVCYSGVTAGSVINHNLGAVPELVIQKKRAGPNDGTWYVWSSAINNSIDGSAYLNTNDQYYNNDTKFSALPTATTLSLTSVANTTSNTYVAYLFASVAGVSKVGTYTGNGSSQTINCGFTAGARFVMVKRTDSTGDWVVLDTARGIVSGNDPFLELNTSAAEQTGEDIVDPDNSGFIVNSTTENINASGGTYIYLAIA